MEKVRTVKMNQDSQIKDMKNNILSRVNSLKDEILNLKVIVIKNLQNEIEKLWQKCERLERRCAKYESDHNTLAQYGRRNNVIVSNIQNYVSDVTLEKSVISVSANIDVYMERQNIEACCRFDKAYKKKIKKGNFAIHKQKTAKKLCLTKENC